ncbi:MAG TPA: hypothetical protein VHN14_26520 [Kofleriaceae bacterium]|nr:hypothetical protein [Kofleriaceae bacterium]
MRMPWLPVAAVVVLVLGTSTAVRADEVAPPDPSTATAAAAPLNYVTVAATTTLFAASNAGDTSGWGHDIGPVIGYGRYVTSTVALELDAGPSFVRGSYASFFLVPAAVWSFSTHVYAAARFLVQVDPEANFYLFPGIGGAYSFDKITLTLELNLSSNVGRGKPDLGVTLTPGIVYSF